MAFASTTEAQKPLPRALQNLLRRSAGSYPLDSAYGVRVVNIKPIIGGVEITVRYITQVGERSQLRAKLYHTAVDLLGETHAALPSPVATTQALAT